MSHFPPRPYLRVMSSQRDQAWYWRPRWQAGEREVDEHVARGDVIADAAEDTGEDVEDRQPVTAAGHPARSHAKG
jgi:hypothetical protein